MLWFVSSLTGVTVIGLLVVFVVFTVTASRAASLTALRETFTSYLAFASPVCLPSATVMSAMLVSPAAADF